jgi:hypothetical protein
MRGASDINFQTHSLNDEEHMQSQDEGDDDGNSMIYDDDDEGMEDDFDK